MTLVTVYAENKTLSLTSRVGVCAHRHENIQSDGAQPISAFWIEYDPFESLI